MVEQRPGRPPRLVMTCAYLALIGLFQVVQAVTVLADWYSESGEEQVKRFTDPLVKEGFSRGDAEMTFRIYLAILMALAGSVAVFAIYTALGHAASRILVTITAPLMAIVSLGQGSFISIVVSVVALSCVFQLWTADVRRWFAQLSGKEPATPAVAAWPPPLPPDSTHPVPPHAAQAQVGPAQAYAQTMPPRPRAAQDVPRLLAVVTLSVSSMVALGCAIYLVMYEFALDRLVQQQLSSGANWMDLTEAEIRDGCRQLAILSWVVLALSMIAIAVSSVMLLRRRRS